MLQSTTQPTALTPDLITSMQSAFDADPHARAMQNAVCNTTIAEVALNRQVITTTDHSFSTKLDDWSVTAQNASGRCWMFAGLNQFRPAAMQQMGLKNFEYSQNYTFFWDKLERANYFLEQIIDTADRDLDDRTVAHMLKDPIGDGGQWNMFVSILKKHGAVPKAAMPETQSSSNSRPMNNLLKSRLREAARALRQAPAEQRQAIKQEHLQQVHRLLCIHLGTPPTAFDWQWTDKDNNFHRDGEMTPQQFGAKYLPADLDDFICLVHDPRPSSPMNQTFTVDRLGNVVDGDPVVYLNVDIAQMKQLTRQTLEDGQPVWFGCDVGQQFHRSRGVWDTDLYDYQGVYGEGFSHDKAQRLLFHQTLMTHAMLFTGVDVTGPEDAPSTRRWRVENSWGPEGGVQGFYTMNDSWFDEYVFEIACHKKYLPDELLQALDTEPIVLPAWDPMGALA